MPDKDKKKTKKKPIKKVPLVTGLVFMIIGSICLVRVFTSPESMQITYATLAIAFFGFGTQSLDKSGVFER